MTVTEALQLILKNEHIPALNYCIHYADFALTLIEYDPNNINSQAFKTQLLYVLNNMTHWRQSKLSTTTATEIKVCRNVLKEASK